MNTIKLKTSTTINSVPTVSDIGAGQMAINTIDERVFFSTGTSIKELALRDHNASMLLSKTTTTSTPLALDANTYDKRLEIADGDCVYVHGVVSATDGNISSSWDINALLKRDGATVSMVGTSSTVAHQDVGAVGWSVVCIADTANNKLKIEVTGETGKTIDWNSSVLITMTG